MIQQVEDMGKLDNTLIIYICGDNGNSPEGTEYGTFNQMTAYNGLLTLPVKPYANAPLRELGIGENLSPHGGAMGLGL